MSDSNTTVSSVHEPVSLLQPAHAAWRYEPTRQHQQGRPQQAPPPEEDDRAGNTRWCKCGNCFTQPWVTRADGLRCCHEIHKMVERIAEAQENYGSTECIIEHPAFASVCLDVHVLEVAWFGYRQQYEEPYEGEQFKRYRHIAYRQLVRFVWKVVGIGVRKRLPACALAKIRKTFSDNDHNYTGFRPVLN